MARRPEEQPESATAIIDEFERRARDVSDQLSELVADLKAFVAEQEESREQ